MSDKKKNILFLSVIASFCVVCLHQNFSWTHFSKDSWWFTSCIIRGICYPAVPIFFMISGAMLINYKSKYDTKTFFRKRVKKVLIPFLVWSALAIIYALLKKDISISDLTFKTVIANIVNYKYQDVFWYFPVCISIYLCMPLFASVEDKSKKNVFTYLSVLYFVLNCFYPFINKVFNIGISLPFSVYVLSNYLFYCVIGWLINNHDMSKWLRYTIYILGILGLILITFGTYYYSKSDGRINEIFLGYIELPCVLYATAIFVFAKYNADKLLNNNNIYKAFEFVGKYTFSIYLLHNFVRNFIVIVFHTNTVSIWWRTIMTFPVVAICIVITWLLRKIPIVKHIVP